MFQNRLVNFILFCANISFGHSFYLSYSGNNISEYTCAQAGSYCSLYNVLLTKENYRYHVKADNPAFVQSVVFELSTIPYFTAIDLCTTFPYLFDIRAEDVGIEEIDGNALELCNSLTTLELNNNRIKAIPDTLFTRPYPQVVQLANNLITRISKDAFASLELELFNLAGNNLNVFPIDYFTNAQFRWLLLQSNQLVDLDVDKLVRRFPKLSEGGLIYGANDIACSRVEEINGILKRNSINYKPIEGYHPYYPKVRYYEEDEVDELPCIPDRAYTSMFYRKLMLLQTKSNGSLCKINL